MFDIQLAILQMFGMQIVQKKLKVRHDEPSN